MRLVGVTGAAGFIGRATCKALLASGIGVRALIRNDRDASRIAPGAAAVAVGDLAAADNLELALAGCDAVIHLAARTSGPAVDSRTGADLFTENLVTTERVCRGASRSGVGRVVYVSSVKAVAEQTFDGPMTEQTVPRPTEPYGRSKLAAEDIVKRLARQLGFEDVIVRPTVVYGPDVPGNFGALIALSRIARWMPLPLAGIENRRSTIFVDNLADALAMLAQHPRAAGETFLISDGRALSTPRLIQSIAAAMGNRAKLFDVNQRTLLAAASLVGARAAYTKLCGSLEVDDSHLRRLTQWSPPYDFERAIALTLRSGTSLVSQVAPA